MCYGAKHARRKADDARDLGQLRGVETTSRSSSFLLQVITSRRPRKAPLQRDICSWTRRDCLARGRLDKQPSWFEEAQYANSPSRGSRRSCKPTRMLARSPQPRLSSSVSILRFCLRRISCADMISYPFRLQPSPWRCSWRPSLRRRTRRGNEQGNGS